MTWLRRHWAGPISLLVHGAVIGAIVAQPALPLPSSAPTLDLSLMLAAVEEAKETPPEKVTEVRPPETVQAVQPEMVQQTPPEMVQPPEPEPPPEPLPDVITSVSPTAIAALPPPEPVRKVKPPPPVPRPRVETVRAEEPPPAPQPAQPSAAPQIASTAPVVVSAPPADYLARLLHALDRAKVYPHDAQKRHQEGTVYLRFSLDRQGRVPSYRIERSSGYAALDRAVAELVERAQPLPPPPEDVAGRELVVPVRFQLR